MKRIMCMTESERSSGGGNPALDRRDAGGAVPRGGEREAVWRRALGGGGSCQELGLLPGICGDGCGDRTAAGSDGIFEVSVAAGVDESCIFLLRCSEDAEPFRDSTLARISGVVTSGRNGIDL
jgi:hypothetical protein